MVVHIENVLAILNFTLSNSFFFNCFFFLVGALSSWSLQARSFLLLGIFWLFVFAQFELGSARFGSFFFFNRFGIDSSILLLLL